MTELTGAERYDRLTQGLRNLLVIKGLPASNLDEGDLTTLYATTASQPVGMLPTFSKVSALPTDLMREFFHEEYKEFKDLKYVLSVDSYLDGVEEARLAKVAAPPGVTDVAEAIAAVESLEYSAHEYERPTPHEDVHEVEAEEIETEEVAVEETSTGYDFEWGDDEDENSEEVESEEEWDGTFTTPVASKSPTEAIGDSGYDFQWPDNLDEEDVVESEDEEEEWDGSIPDEVEPEVYEESDEEESSASAYSDLEDDEEEWDPNAPVDDEEYSDDEGESSASAYTDLEDDEEEWDPNAPVDDEVEPEVYEDEEESSASAYNDLEDDEEEWDPNAPVDDSDDEEEDEPWVPNLDSPGVPHTLPSALTGGSPFGGGAALAAVGSDVDDLSMAIYEGTSKFVTGIFKVGRRAKDKMTGN